MRGAEREYIRVSQKKPQDCNCNFKDLRRAGFTSDLS